MFSASPSFFNSTVVPSVLLIIRTEVISSATKEATFDLNVRSALDVYSTAMYIPTSISSKTTHTSMLYFLNISFLHSFFAYDPSSLVPDYSIDYRYH